MSGWRRSSDREPKQRRWNGGRGRQATTEKAGPSGAAGGASELPEVEEDGGGWKLAAVVDSGAMVAASGTRGSPRGWEGEEEEASKPGSASGIFNFVAYHI